MTGFQDARVLDPGTDSLVHHMNDRLASTDDRSMFGSSIAGNEQEMNRVCRNEPVGSSHPTSPTRMLARPRSRRRNFCGPPANPALKTLESLET
jgi:hypothetical protein